MTDLSTPAGLPAAQPGDLVGAAPAGQAGQLGQPPTFGEWLRSIFGGAP